jgi:hypothetical protein
VIWHSINDQSQFRHDPKKKHEMQANSGGAGASRLYFCRARRLYLQFTGDAAIVLPILKTISIVR